MMQVWQAQDILTNVRRKELNNEKKMLQKKTALLILIYKKNAKLSRKYI